MYNQIDSNKRKTWILVLGFCVFVIIVLGYIGVSSGIDLVPSLVLAAGFATGYSLIAYFISDKVALITQGAQAIKKEDAPELYRLVENLSITAGMPMPKVYIIKDNAPNAFATGRGPEHAAIAVTTGLLNILTKTELEGVIAHEMAHIKNYDVRLMTIVVVLVGLIVLVSDILLRVNLFGGRDNKSNGALFLIGFLLGILSPLVGYVIKFAISRTREYLADADGALLTRHPEGLASALEKIGSYTGKMKRANHATAHMFISSPFGYKRPKAATYEWTLFMTHPPIKKRIAKLREMA